MGVFSTKIRIAIIKIKRIFKKMRLKKLITMKRIKPVKRFIRVFEIYLIFYRIEIGIIY